MGNKNSQNPRAPGYVSIDSEEKNENRRIEHKNPRGDEQKHSPIVLRKGLYVNPIRNDYGNPIHQVTDMDVRRYIENLHLNYHGDDQWKKAQFENVRVILTEYWYRPDYKYYTEIYDRKLTHTECVKGWKIARVFRKKTGKLSSSCIVLVHLDIPIKNTLFIKTPIRKGCDGETLNIKFTDARYPNGIPPSNPLYYVECMSDNVVVTGIQFIGDVKAVQIILDEYEKGLCQAVSNFDPLFPYIYGHRHYEPNTGRNGRGCKQGIHWYLSPEAALKEANKGHIADLVRTPVITKLIARPRKYSEVDEQLIVDQGKYPKLVKPSVRSNIDNYIEIERKETAELIDITLQYNKKKLVDGKLVDITVEVPQNDSVIGSPNISQQNSPIQTPIQSPIVTPKQSPVQSPRDMYEVNVPGGPSITGVATLHNHEELREIEMDVIQPKITPTVNNLDEVKNTEVKNTEVKNTDVNNTEVKNSVVEIKITPKQERKKEVVLVAMMNNCSDDKNGKEKSFDDVFNQVAKQTTVIPQSSSIVTTPEPSAPPMEQGKQVNISSTTEPSAPPMSPRGQSQVNPNQVNPQQVSANNIHVCGICTDLIEDKHDIIATVCEHRFHLGCLQDMIRWHKDKIQKQSVTRVLCPICQRDITELSNFTHIKSDSRNTNRIKFHNDDKDEANKCDDCDGIDEKVKQSIERLFGTNYLRHNRYSGMR